MSPAPGLARWWESLDDPILGTLVEKALAHSPDIDIAEARTADIGVQKAKQLRW